MRLELTIERSYQIQSHNRLFKMTGLVRRFSKRRNLSSSRIHCCYIYIGTEFKGKHILEQDELFCCVISSRLKAKNKQTNKQKNFSVTKTKEYRKKSLSFSPSEFQNHPPPPGPWTYQHTLKLTLSVPYFPSTYL